MENIVARHKSYFSRRFILMFNLLVAIGVLFSISSPALAGGVYTGTAFRDYNANGTKQTAEPGIEGVIVKIYDKSGANQGSTTTAANGTYSISPGGTGPYRIEFTLPASLSFLKAGAAGNTTVQFLDDGGGTANVGFNNPADYFSSTNPDLVTNKYVEGSNSGTDTTLVSFPYNSSGSSTSPDSEAQAVQIGSTFGLAYQRSSDTMFAAAYQKRHAGYGSADSTGAIYAIQNPGDGLTTGVSLFVDLNALYGSAVFGTNPHPKTTANFAIDGSSYGVVGKVAFGDMDIADDELSLWAVNLNDRQLYQIPLGSDPANPVAPTVTTNIKRYPLADSGSPLPDMPANCATVTSARLRSR